MNNIPPKKKKQNQPKKHQKLGKKTKQSMEKLPFHEQAANSLR